MASDDLKTLVARGIASGETIADLARRHGYSWKGMKKLVDSREVQALIEVERQSNGELADRCRVRLLQLGAQALENIAEVLRNPRHPKRLETSRFVVEKILPTRTMVEADVNVAVSRNAESQELLDEAMIKIANSLQQLRDAQAGRPDPLSRVRLGSEALTWLALPDGKANP